MNAGLYIHVPFCLKKCNYCGFFSITDPGLTEGFVSALLREIELYRGFGAFDSVYFGGGTPSLLRIAQLHKLVVQIQSTFTVAEDAEWTIEANPGDLNLPYCLALRQCGFNRINIGIQSLSDPVLSLLGRRHTRRDALAAVESARSAGFENFGLDFIYGIPGQDLNSCVESLKELVSLSPAHLSCYQLTIEGGTPLADQYRAGVYSKPDEDAEIGFFMAISEVLTSAGYIHYEVSNYARSMDLRSRHNRKYWDHTPYLGLGPAAHSFDGRRRWWNRRSVEDYCRDLKKGLKPVADTETLTSDDLRLETLSLGMRTMEGVAIDRYNREDGSDLLLKKKALIGRLADEGLLVLENGILRPTLRGMALADAIARELSL